MNPIKGGSLTIEYIKEKDEYIFTHTPGDIETLSLKEDWSFKRSQLLEMLESIYEYKNTQ